MPSSQTGNQAASGKIWSFVGKHLVGASQARQVHIDRGASSMSSLYKQAGPVNMLLHKGASQFSRIINLAEHSPGVPSPQ